MTSKAIQELRKHPLSEQLLRQNGLMTPALVKTFGDVIAVENFRKTTERVYLRRSSIFTALGQHPILDAELAINHHLLPQGFLSRLKNGRELFGALLLEFGLDVSIEGLVIFRREDQRFGRRLHMRDTVSGVIISRVEEVLQPEQLLQSQRQPKPLNTS